MRPDDIRTLLEQRPFQTFRLHLTHGTIFELKHPDMAVVGRSTVTVAIPPEQSAERRAVIALLHIMWVEIVVPVT